MHNELFNSWATNIEIQKRKGTHAERVRRSDWVEKFFLSLQENKRLDWLVPLTRILALVGSANSVGDVVKFDSCDSEMTYIAKTGFSLQCGVGFS